MQCLEEMGWKGTPRIVPVPLSAHSPVEAEEQSRLHESMAGQAFFVVEDRWRRDSGFVRQRLAAHMGRQKTIFARKCTLRRIDKPEASEFLKLSHSYGDAACRYRYGLFAKQTNAGPKNDGQELVAVACFSNARTWIKDGVKMRSYEWVRYASLPSTRVLGGMGRLLKAFIDEVKPDDVMSYADLEWSDGAAYRSLGFVEEGTKAPVMFWVDPDTWTRTPLSRLSSDKLGKGLFYRNFGSKKYRLNLNVGRNQG